MTRPLDWLREVARDPDVKPALGVALQLIARAKGSGPHAGTLFASQPDLAEATGLKERRIHDLLHELMDHGYLEMTRRGGRAGDGSNRASEYRLTLPSTCNGVQVEDDSQPALESSAEPASTCSGVQVDTDSQPAIDGASERVSTCNPVQPKREELPREKGQLASAADDIVNAHRLRPEHHQKILAALQGDPDPATTAAEVCSEPLSKTTRKPIAVVLARIKAAQNGEQPRLSITGGAPVQPGKYSSGVIKDWGLSSGGAPAPASTFKYTGPVSF